jgi:serine 3-dehydrogenase
MTFQNKVVVITGASAGFGQAAALAFGKLGARIFLGARRLQKLEDTARQALGLGCPEAQVHFLDVTRTESVEAFVGWLKQRVGKVDVLINNAGGAKGLEPVAEGKDEDWEFMLQANVLGLLRMTRAVLPLMVNNAGSTIINIGSVAGHTAYEGGAAYCAAKAGEAMITKALRLELCGTGVRVCSVDPGLAETEFSLVRFKGDAERARKVYEGMTPLTAEDVAEAMVWVAARPAHVCVNELVITPTDQAAIHKIYRRKADGQAVGSGGRAF